MRWLKLRAWFPEKQEMKLVAMHNVYEGNTTYLYLSPMPMSDYEPIELMQYTGLKDKNGNDIYEGDIIEAYVFDTNNTRKNIGKVAYSKDRHGFVFVPTSWELKNLWYPLHSVITCNHIGNIYENPELLEKEQHYVTTTATRPYSNRTTIKS